LIGVEATGSQKSKTVLNGFHFVFDFSFTFWCVYLRAETPYCEMKIMPQLEKDGDEVS
jgi:thiol-disulfide isomerase/thioredoxin